MSSKRQQNLPAWYSKTIFFAEKGQKSFFLREGRRAKFFFFEIMAEELSEPKDPWWTNNERIVGLYTYLG